MPQPPDDDEAAPTTQVAADRPVPPAGQSSAPGRRRRLLMVSIALAAVLLLGVGGGVGGYLLLRAPERGEGAADPVAAVNGFLTAVYTDRDVDRAADLTCRQARDDDKLAAKVQQVADLVKRYDTPQFRWTAPEPDERNTERALVSTTLTLTTADERTVELGLAFTVVRESGWWVCDVLERAPVE